MLSVPDSYVAFIVTMMFAADLVLFTPWVRHRSQQPKRWAEVSATELGNRLLVRSNFPSREPRAEV
jgi:hypothetical protein